MVLHRTAFGGDYEADLVAGLEADSLVVASLVSLEYGEVVGHSLFSDLSVEVEGRPIRAVSLAPMAVRPDRQRRGIGSVLIENGLALVRDRERTAVIVLGSVQYYSRFGFSSELARKLFAPFTGEASMALELVSGALAGKSGSVGYPAAFRIGE